ARQPAQPPASASAAARARQQRQELERVRRERAALEQRMQALQTTAHDLREEVTNLDRQADATARLVATLDRQLLTLDDDLQDAGTRLARAEDELSAKQVGLRRRLVEIYKRGALWEVEAYLSAASFADLVARYKYLHELARRDRSLVRRVEELRNTVAGQRALLVQLQGELARNRAEKAEEERRMRALESAGARNLRQVQEQAARTRRQLATIQRDEQRLAGLIASLESARRRAETRPNARPSAPSTLRTSDLGRLDWPVNGTLLYRFGRVRSANNTTTRWNGVGIGAAEGTPVRAVAAGEVMVAEAIGTYGTTVILQHGGGDYSVYGSLGRADVRKGQTIAKGDVVGTVGAGDADLPAHLHFEVRPQGRAVDPLEWLRGRR
ncbi:peptidoglycan DD-metalloendopeptidase family protein, partial [Roseisolibacter sp. H3M3-2]|uniref:murein hydrolase activator EnvC family protein n=1 Tax=Roseisolibacter sp. H3M3-2 TaxID=3031323 RepID=UPI0023DBD3C2